MKNLKEFKELIIRYETITFEEICEKWNDADIFHAERITGFGDSDTCTLCQSTIVNGIVSCSLCVWGNGGDAQCNWGPHRDTYFMVGYANTPEELLTAFRLRAAHMRKHLKSIGVDF